MGKNHPRGVETGTHNPRPSKPRVPGSSPGGRASQRTGSTEERCTPVGGEASDPGASPQRSPSGHAWSVPDASLISVCENAGCTARFDHAGLGWWQARKGCLWRPAHSNRWPLPTCSGAEAPAKAPAASRGQTCGRCAHFPRCKKLIHDLPADGPCDFSPSRFKAASPAPSGGVRGGSKPTSITETQAMLEEASKPAGVVCRTCGCRPCICHDRHATPIPPCAGAKQETKAPPGGLTRIVLTAPVVESVGSRSFTTLRAGGVILTLEGDDTQPVRGLAVALYSARTVVLEVAEAERFPVPQDFPRATAAPNPPADSETSPPGRMTDEERAEWQENVANLREERDSERRLRDEQSATIAQLREALAQQKEMHQRDRGSLLAGNAALLRALTAILDRTKILSADMGGQHRYALDGSRDASAAIAAARLLVQDGTPSAALLKETKS